MEHLHTWPSQCRITLREVLYESVFLRSLGRLFQIRGPSYLNDLKPSLVDFTQGNSAVQDFRSEYAECFSEIRSWRIDGDVLWMILLVFISSNSNRFGSFVFGRTLLVPLLHERLVATIYNWDDVWREYKNLDFFQGMLCDVTFPDLSPVYQRITACISSKGGHTRYWRLCGR
jgi:hypothetical protein